MNQEAAMCGANQKNKPTQEAAIRGANQKNRIKSCYMRGQSIELGEAMGMGISSENFIALGILGL